jgi:hypothetical protein
MELEGGLDCFTLPDLVSRRFHPQPNLLRTGRACALGSCLRPGSPGRRDSGNPHPRAQSTPSERGLHNAASGQLAPNSYVVYWGSFGWWLFGQIFGGVADVEGADDVPVGLGSYGGADVGEAWFAGAPADADAERVGG